jgi:hypothetical protein
MKRVLDLESSALDRTMRDYRVLKAIAIGSLVLNIVLVELLILS